MQASIKVLIYVNSTVGQVQDLNKALLVDFFYIFYSELENFGVWGGLFIDHRRAKTPLP